MDLMSQTRWPAVLCLSLLLFKSSEAAPGITYCSPENLAPLSSNYYAEFMSTGLCSDTCSGAFAFAVVQGSNCWCSNYAPADQQDTSQCDEPCPGISTELCGNQGLNLFGYFQLPGGRPLGTSGYVPQPSSTSTSSSIYSSSSVQVEYSTSSPSSTYIAPSSTEETRISSTSSSPSPSSPPTPSPPAEPSATRIYTSVTTVTGQVRTVVITPTADSSVSQSSRGGSKGVSAGTVAGIVVGVVLGLGLLIGLGVWLFIKRRRNRRNSSDAGSFAAERLAGNGNNNNDVPSRQVSQLSSAGLLGKAPRIHTNISSTDNDPRSAGTVSSNNADRKSLGTDQRLNPWAIYSQEDRASNVSLQDNQDYSRQLRIANPDE